MALPFFYIETISSQSLIVLSEETSKHIIQVLRMKAGEQLQLTDGKGKIVTAEIISENKKATEVKTLTTVNCQQSTASISIAISLIKNNNRFEWFLEKATEIGVSEIIPLICKRTEKQNFRHDRMKNILISAMLQSQQAWLPILQEPVNFSEVVSNSSYQNKFVAHCKEEEKVNLFSSFATIESSQVSPVGGDLEGALILIGPEGDFTKEEIESAKQNNFIPVSLGDTRLRTETAGIVAAVLLNSKNIN